MSELGESSTRIYSGTTERISTHNCPVLVSKLPLDNNKYFEKQLLTHYYYYYYYKALYAKSLQFQHPQLSQKAFRYILVELSACTRMGSNQGFGSLLLFPPLHGLCDETKLMTF